MSFAKTFIPACAFVIFASFLLTTEAGLLRPAAPFAAIAKVGPVTGIHEVDPHPQYAFAYNVQDALTGDSKSQQEVRDGEVVRGSYSVLDADGSLRTVFYTADPINGFNAVVQRGPVPVVASRPSVAIAPAPVPAASTSLF